jgi:iron complex outermembrane recepter protein
MKVFNHKWCLLAGTAVAACLALPVQAQETASARTVAPADNRIGEVVVTARRRAESQQSVPIAVTAITTQTLREKAISTPYDLTASTPGIAAASGSAQRNDVWYFIRGQGSTFGSSPSVVTYLADVPQQANGASGGSNITFYDLESVQVLKGPQGTLFGRSTTAGAVLLTPKAPGEQFDGFIEGALGNYSAREFTGAVNVPIIGDRLAVRIAGNYSYHNGFAHSVTTGQDLDDRDRSSYRISLLARPTDWLTNTTIFSDVDIHENGTANVLGLYEPNGVARLVVDPRVPGGSTVTGSLIDTRVGLGIVGLNPGVTAANATGYGRIAVGGVCSALAGVYAANGQTVADCVNQRIALIDSARASLDSEARRLAAGGDPRDLATTRPNFIRSQVQTFINTTQLDFGNLGFLGDTAFKNIFSTVRNLHSEAIREIQGGVGTGLPFNDLNLTNPNCTALLCTGQVQTQDVGAGRNKWLDVYSEEAQLSGRINGKHDWLIGYFTEHQADDQYLGWPPTFQTLNGAFTLPAGLPGLSGGFANQKSSQTGYFGQTTIDFSEFGVDGLRFTAGFRHSIVKQSLVQTPAFLDPRTGIQVDPTSPPISAKLKQTANSYTFALDYKFSPNVMAYATTRKGFKQGGINAMSVIPASQGIAAAEPTFAPEKVKDYEVGLKADYDLAGISARTNVAIFQADYSGLQRASAYFNGQTTSSQIVNAAKLRSRGLELEQIFRFTPEFTVNLNYAYLDSRFRSFPGVIVRPTDGAVIERINSAITGAPKNKVDVTVRYAHDLGDNGELVFGGNVSYQSNTYLEDDGLFNVSGTAHQKAYTLANLHADWNNVMGNPVDLSIFVKNVFDKLYKIGSGGLISSQLGTTTFIYGDPRMIGVQVRARFGQSANP